MRQVSSAKRTDQECFRSLAVLSIVKIPSYELYSSTVTSISSETKVLWYISFGFNPGDVFPSGQASVC